LSLAGLITVVHHHISAISKEGKLLWHKDAFVDIKLSRGPQDNRVIVIRLEPYDRDSELVWLPIEGGFPFVLLEAETGKYEEFWN
jgi:hypothetical protein